MCCDCWGNDEVEGTGDDGKLVTGDRTGDGVASGCNGVFSCGVAATAVAAVC